MRAIIHWFVDNPIAANLLMLIIVLYGAFYYFDVGKEVFPTTEPDSLIISATYPGASPAEVEQQLVVRIEEAIADVEGINEINSSARESQASIIIEAINDYDIQRLLNNVKTRIDSLDTLPEETENITVTESLIRSKLMSAAIYGNVSQAILQDTAQWLQQELLQLDAVSSVDIGGTLERELSIEVSQHSLQAYQLSLEDISNAVRQRSINLPAGTIKTEAGNFQLQARGQAYELQEFANIVIRAGEDGAELTLGNIATLHDGFEDVDQSVNFNGYPATFLELYTSNPPDIVKAADTTRENFEKLRNQLPPGVEVDVWFDWSLVFKSRMKLLLDNTLYGLILVIILLTLFLRPWLALWVSVGIAVSFLGVFWVLPFTGVTLNMLSMYGFLLALGIVVDDAIVVGESIYSAQQKGLQGHVAAKDGAVAVSKPVTFAVVSTMIFFSAMYGLEGFSAVLAIPIATVVIICLLFSLIESLWILPSHLSHVQPEIIPDKPNVLVRLRLNLSRGMESIANNHYRRFLQKTLNMNGLTLTTFIIFFVIVVSVYGYDGYLKKSFRPIVTSSSVTIRARLPEGVSFTQTKRIQDQIEQAAYQLKTDSEMLKINGDDDFIRAIKSEAKNNNVTVEIGLTGSEQRQVNIIQVKDRWQKLIGPLPGVKELNLRFTITHNEKDLRFRVSLPGSDRQQLADAITQIREQLARYKAVYQVEDTLEGLRTEYEIQLKPHAETLGLSLADIGRQLRQGYYGEEIQRIPKGVDDIGVWLRYPKAERSSIGDINSINIHTNDGRFVALNEVADVLEVPGYTEIKREDRRRTIVISAQVENGVDSLALAEEFVANNLEAWQQRYRGLSIEIAGAVAEEKQFNIMIFKNFIIAFLISFGLMAIIFRSYWQPLIILTAIPFGFIGAILGHLLMGQAITMNSMLGFIACAGVVVNDNLVLLDRIHRLRDQGLELLECITQAGSDRFRAIILTSLTTFIGLLPILSETSIQAQFLIPMVVSLAFGVLFASVVTLIFVPNMYLLGERVNS